MTSKSTRAAQTTKVAPAADDKTHANDGKREPLIGTPGRDLLRFADDLTPEEVAELTEGLWEWRQVDPNGW